MGFGVLFAEHPILGDFVGFLCELLLCGVGIICCFRISGCFAWMVARVVFDCGWGGCGLGVALF